MNNLVGQYINNKLTINNINDFGIKNNIILSESELNALLFVAKNHYQDLLKGNDSEVKVFLQDKLTKDNYDKVLHLYEEYREKYQNYL